MKKDISSSPQEKLENSPIEEQFDFDLDGLPVSIKEKILLEFLQNQANLDKIKETLRDILRSEFSKMSTTLGEEIQHWVSDEKQRVSQSLLPDPEEQQQRALLQGAVRSLREDVQELETGKSKLEKQLNARKMENKLLYETIRRLKKEKGK